jgi:hypothetical protein
MEGLRGQRTVFGFRVYPPTQSPTFNINSTGFRAPEFAPRDCFEYRIALFGGSTAFGWEVADHRTIAGFMDRDLAARGYGDVRLYNLGIPAFVFKDEVKTFEAFQPSVRANAALFYHGANDGLSWYRSWFHGAGEPMSLEGEDTPLNRFLAGLRRIRIWVLIEETVNRLLPPELPDGVEASLDRAVADYRRLHDAAQSICRANGMPCRFFLQPIVFDKQGKHIVDAEIAADARRVFPLYDRYQQS